MTGVLVAVVPSPTHLKSGRKVARQAAVIPIPGSMIDQIVVSTALRKKLGPMARPLMKGSRTTETMLPIVPSMRMKHTASLVLKGRSGLPQDEDRKNGECPVRSGIDDSRCQVNAEEDLVGETLSQKLVSQVLCRIAASEEDNKELLPVSSCAEYDPTCVSTYVEQSRRWCLPQGQCRQSIYAKV